MEMKAMASDRVNSRAPTLWCLVSIGVTGFRAQLPYSINDPLSEVREAWNGFDVEETDLLSYT